MTVLVLLTFSKQFFWQACRATSHSSSSTSSAYRSATPSYACLHFSPHRPSALWLGGYIGDKIGRKYVIWCSILGAAPFALCLPYAGYAVTIALSVIVGLVISSAFSAILVFATELKPSTYRHHRRTVFRPLVRSGRHRSRILRMACRNDRHTICIPREHTPPPAWHRGRTAPRHETGRQEAIRTMHLSVSQFFIVILQTYNDQSETNINVIL